MNSTRRFHSLFLPVVRRSATRTRLRGASHLVASHLADCLDGFGQSEMLDRFHGAMHFASVLFASADEFSRKLLRHWNWDEMNGRIVGP